MKKLSERLELVRDRFGMDYEDADALDEAAELARSFEASPVAVILGECNEYPSLYHIDPESWKDEEVIRTLHGNSVRILPEKEGY